MSEIMSTVSDSATLREGDTFNSAVQRALRKNRWSTIDAHGLALLTSPLLSRYKQLTHAFTTRHGGETPPPADSFNLGRHIKTEESMSDALKNRRTLCSALDLSYERMVVPAQVHSPLVVLSEDQEDFAGVDGIATDTVNRPILLHFADCVPVIIYDPVRAALCIVHAGWKGTAGSIAKNGVDTLVSKFGSKPADIVAAVGPAIGICCYPTGGDVSEKLSATISNSEAFIDRSGEQPRPDLKAINAMQLIEAGVGEVDVTDLCTCCQPELFFSHRQSGGATGRQGAIGCLL